MSGPLIEVPLNPTTPCCTGYTVKNGVCLWCGKVNNRELWDYIRDMTSTLEHPKCKGLLCVFSLPTSPAYRYLSREGRPVNWACNLYGDKLDECDCRFCTTFIQRGGPIDPAPKF